jgi:hypothetical protein
MSVKQKNIFVAIQKKIPNSNVNILKMNELYIIVSGTEIHFNLLKKKNQ